MKLVFPLVVIISLLPQLSRASDSLNVIKPIIKEISSESECILKYKVVSKAKNKIQFEKYLFISGWGNQYADIWILLEKKDKNTFITVEFSNPPPPMLPADEAYKKTYLTLNDTLPIEINLYHNYEDLKKGEYRFKILVRASKNNSVADVESGWLYFKIGQDL